MFRPIIGRHKRIKFEYLNKFKFQCHGYTRMWFIRGVYHRVDGGPAFEDMRDGYCQWWKRGMFVRDNK